MKYILLFLISQTVLLPIIAGLIRFRRIDKSYRPFLILLVLGFLVEIVSFFLIRYIRNNAIAVNIYTLAEWILIALQFHTWGFLRQKRALFYVLLAGVAMVWITENLVFGMIMSWSPYFLFLYSFIIVLLSVNEINFMIIHYNRNLFRNPKFLICIGFIIYFIYMIVDYWAFEVSLFGKKEISVTITQYMGYVNVVTNIIYAVALLLIPAPQKFTLK